MIVSEVQYIAEDQAALVADYIRLKLTLEKNGVDMKWETFDGESKYMSGRAWLMQAEYERVNADAIRVEAFDLEVPTHIIIVNGRRFEIPLTGAQQTRVYRFPL